MSLQSGESEVSGETPPGAEQQGLGGAPIHKQLSGDGTYSNLPSNDNVANDGTTKKKPWWMNPNN